MNNNAFETTMINAVNENAKAAEEKRATRFQKYLRKFRERKQLHRTLAIIEILVWLCAFVAIVIACGVLSWLGQVPCGLATAFPAVFGLIAGFRVCGLFGVI